MPVKPVTLDLTPHHLMDPEVSSTDLKEQAEAKIAAVEKPKDDKAAMRERVYTFPFNYVDNNGKEYAGTFTNTVPTIRVRQTMGVIRAQLGGGVPYETLDEFTREMNMIVAHLTCTLAEKDRPAWAKDLRNLDDMQVLYKLWEVVALHESTFHGDR